jgi:outer membrane immunogenic protein
MKSLLIATALVLGFSSAAFAADAIVEEAVTVVPGFTWTGGYIGGQVGYAWGDGHAEDTGGSNTDPDPDGFIGGVYVGYNHQLSNNIVIGGELDVVYADVDGTAGVFDDDGIPEGVDFTQELKWSGAARVRLGYAVDRFLPYVAGGVAFGEIGGGNGGNTDEFKDTYTGWTIGVGTEYAFTDNMIGRVESRYTDFGDESFFDGAVNQDLSTNEVRFGIAYKF